VVAQFKVVAHDDEFQSLIQMTYQYSFDKTDVGNARWAFKSYELIQGSLAITLQEVQRWNATAIEHGASRRPYEREETDLNQIIAWGRKRLDASNGSDITITGISIGSLRYLKAALLFAIRKRQEEIDKKEDQGWPDAVISSLKEAIASLKKLSDMIKNEPADLLWQLMPKEPPNSVPVHRGTDMAMQWDVFICHASEDKDDIVRPLVAALQTAGLKAWYDEFTLKVGDSLRRSIDRGLAHSRYGIVVLSPSFLKKEWPQKELDGLTALEVSGRKVILPVWHKIDAVGIRQYSPILADRVATSSTKGIKKVVQDILDAIGHVVHSEVEVGVRVQSDLSENSIDLEVSYKKVKIRPERHDYLLEIKLKNLGNEPLVDYHVDVELPARVIEHTENNQFYVQERSSMDFSFFRKTNQINDQDIYPGDTKIVMSIPYYMDRDIYWSRGDLLTQIVKASLYRKGFQPLMLEKPFGDFQIF
jgi:hypothetical protein